MDSSFSESGTRPLCEQAGHICWPSLCGGWAGRHRGQGTVFHMGALVQWGGGPSYPACYDLTSLPSLPQVKSFELGLR